MAVPARESTGATQPRLCSGAMGRAVQVCSFGSVSSRFPSECAPLFLAGRRKKNLAQWCSRGHRVHRRCVLSLSCLSPFQVVPCTLMDARMTAAECAAVDAPGGDVARGAGLLPFQRVRAADGAAPSCCRRASVPAVALTAGVLRVLLSPEAGPVGDALPHHAAFRQPGGSVADLTWPRGPVHPQTAPW